VLGAEGRCVNRAGRSRRVGALCLAGASAAWPAAAQTAPSVSVDAEAVSAKVSPLLGQVLGRVLPATQDAPGAEAGLFRRLAQQQKLASAGVPSAAPQGAMVPALAYAMEQLDPQSFAVIRPLPVAGSGALLRTGDVFVLQFSTSLPGQVRLENVDPQGRVADLGTYTVLVDQLNRIPRDKGIQLQGQPGVERLRFYFYPCLPLEAEGKRWAAEFQGRLPNCTSVATASSGNAGATRALGVVRPRALVNLTQPDSHLAFAGSNEYQPGEVTLMEAQIRHEGRSHGR
jgi:hypothetical protein